MPRYNSHLNIDEYEKIKKAHQDYYSGYGTAAACAQKHNLSINVFNYYKKNPARLNMVYRSEQEYKNSLQPAKPVPAHKQINANQHYLQPQQPQQLQQPQPQPQQLQQPQPQQPRPQPQTQQPYRTTQLNTTTKQKPAYTITDPNIITNDILSGIAMPRAKK